jgi:ribose-phosphate pyrophosphokinase
MNSIIFDLDGRNDLINNIVSICDNLQLGELVTESFSDGEVSSYFITSVRGKRVYILSSPNSSDKIMKLMLILDAAKRGGATEIIPIIPYMPYCRSDKKDQPRGPIGAKVMAEMIENRGTTSVITFDLHADQIQGFFNIPVIHMEGKYLFDRYIFELYRDYCGDNIVLCAPDAGAGKRVKGYRDQLKSRWEIDLPMVYIDKTRAKANVIDTMTIIGEVRAKDVIIIDDMCDTAGTLCKAAEELKGAGAKSVRAITTHGVLSGPALKRIHESISNGIMDRFICSDSLPITGGVTLEDKYYETSDFITQITTAKQICKAIIATEEHRSVETLKTETR